MWAKVLMTLLLAGGPDAGLVFAPPEPPRAPPSPIFRSTPASSEILFASGFASSRFHVPGAWLSQDGTKVAVFTAQSPASDAQESTLVVKDVTTDARVWRRSIFTEDESQDLQPVV